MSSYEQIVKSRRDLIGIVGKLVEDNRRYKPIFDWLTTNDDYAGFSLDDPTRIAYARKDCDKFDPKRRVKVTLQRYIMRQFKAWDTYFAECEIETFAANVFLNSGVPLDIVEHTGSKIVDTYRDSTGETHSCMAGGCAIYTELYSLNPDVVSIATYKEDNVLRGRCLVWRADDGVTYLDRIYTTSSAIVERFRAYARAKGYGYRRHATACADRENPFTKPNGDNVSQLSVTLDDSDAEYYPYMDSFRYAERLNSGLLRLWNSDCVSHESVLCSCSGGYGEEPGIQCYECEDNYYPDDMTVIDGNHICHYCRDENYVHVNGEWCHINDCFECDGCGERTHSDDAFHAHDDRGRAIRLCNGCADDCERCPCCNEEIYRS